MALEFASQDRPVQALDERFSGIGNGYASAKASRLTRPASQPPRDQKRRLQDAKRVEKEVAASILQAKAEAILKRSVAGPAPRRHRSMAERRFRLADLLREAGRQADSQRQDAAGYQAARDEWVSILSGRLLKKLRTPAARMGGTSEV
jgi:hypothetical protein